MNCLNSVNRPARLGVYKRIFNYAITLRNTKQNAFGTYRGNGVRMGNNICELNTIMTR